MEPTSGQRRVVFLVIVLALAGLGTYLFVPGAFGFGRRAVSPAAAQTPASSASPAPPSAQPAPEPVPVSSGAPSSSPALPDPVAPIGSHAADIYRWLPFRPADLTKASEVAVQFGDMYDTFSYSESASAYARSLQQIAASDLVESLQRGYATPGLAGPRVKDKQVSTGKTTVNSLRAFGSGSFTFVVTIVQKITATKSSSNSSTQYAVTVVGGGSQWQVSDIELATAGNF
jgi:hypothetical protein